MRALTIPLIFCLCLACGCGSLIRGNTQEIRIDSYPPGASGEVDGMSIQTPAKLMLTRNEPHTVVLRKEGYTAHRTEINKEFSWSPFITDLVFWKVLRSKGLSAGAWRLTPEEIYANLEIEEASMSPALEPGDWVVAKRRAGELARGDVVVFRDPAETGMNLVKRVIGLGGETIGIESGRVTIDGALLADRWANGLTTPDGSWAVPEGHVWFLGDNRGASTSDGRTLGPTPVDDTGWVVVARYWPTSRAGAVT
jgi:signal peptidase I